MTEEWEENPNEWVDEATGEILEIPTGVGDRLAWAVSQRHHAKEEEDEWAKRRHKLDALIQAEQGVPKAVFDGIVSAIKGGTYNSTDAKALANDLYFSEVPRDVLTDVIAAATAFRRAELSEEMQAFYDQHTEKKQKRSWVETSIVLEAAPRRKAS